MQLLTLEEASRELRVSMSTLYRMLARGEIPALRLRRQWRFKKNDLLQHMRQNGVKASA